jgi:hypothetical protein
MKMNIMRIGLSVAVFVASFFSQLGAGNAFDPSPGFGEPHGYVQLAQFEGEGRHGGRKNFCEKYAESAVDQSRQNSRRGCGYTGDRWNSNYQKHFKWCMSVDRETADSEAGARADDIGRCDSGGRGNREFCRSYAQSAVQQNDRNDRRGCGYNGDRWHSNYQDHFRWCLDVEREEAESQTNSRDGDLRACRRPH